MTTRRFADSFHPKVKPPAGEPCALKWHYTGVMRELVGYFDNMAAIDPGGERFVFTSIAYILKNAKVKRYNGKPYSESAIRHALAELRARRIISKQLVRERWVKSGERGHQVLRKLTGSIVAPHDCIAHMVGDECHFVGPVTHRCGRWQRTGDAGPGSVLYWAGCAQHGTNSGPPPAGPGTDRDGTVMAPAIESKGQANACERQAGLAPVQATLAPSSAGLIAGQSAGQSAERSAGYCAEWSAGPIANPDFAQVADPLDSNGQNPAVSLCNRQHPQEPIKPTKPDYPAKPAEQSKNLGGQDFSHIAAQANVTKTVGVGTRSLGVEVNAPAAHADETIGQRFAGYDDEQLLEEISDGEIDVYKLKITGSIGRHGVESGDVQTVAIYARKAIAEIAAQPWPATLAACARLMDRTIRLMRKDSVEYPPGWLLVLKELQRSGNKPCSWKRTGSDDFVRDPAWEMCRDGIRRREADRVTERYTVKAADGVWDRP